MADRPEKILELVRAANNAMAEAAEGTSANEVFSAYLTMAGHAIETAKEMGVPAEALRQMVYLILLRCDDSTQKVM